MYRKYLLVLVLLCGLSFQLFAADDNNDDSSSSSVSIPSWLIDAGLKFINNPDDVFYNFHLDNVDYSPNRPEKTVGIRTNFFTTFFPFSWGNANLKIKVLNDGMLSDWIPQVDLVGSYGRILALDFVPSSAFESEDSTATFKTPTMQDYSAGVFLTKAVSDETRIYAGFQYSVFTLQFEFPEPVELTDEASISKLGINRVDYIVVSGITNIISDEKRMLAYVGYGFNYKKIFSRFAWQYEHLEMGFNIYPEGLLVIHPFLGWHWDF